MARNILLFVIYFAFLCAVFCKGEDSVRPSSVTDKKRHRRSDDVSPLQPVVSQLAQRLTAMEAKATALQNEVNALTSHKPRCETGKQGLSPHDKPEIVKGNYHERRHTAHVNFAHPFKTTPWVAVSLAMVNEDSGANLRVDSGAGAVTPLGFDIYAFEWHDTHLYSVTVTWIACNM